MTSESISLPTSRQAAVEAQFAPFLRLALTTVALAMGGMFGVATARTAAAFAEPHSYLGRFTNREFHADYSSTAHHLVQVISVPLDGEGGTEPVPRTVEVEGFGQLSVEVLGAAQADTAARRADARAGAEARSARSATSNPARTERPPVSQPTPRVREPMGRVAESNALAEADDKRAAPPTTSDDQANRRSSPARETPTPVAGGSSPRTGSTAVPRRTPTPGMVSSSNGGGAQRASTPESQPFRAASPAARATPHASPERKKPTPVPTPSRAPATVSRSVSR